MSRFRVPDDCTGLTVEQHQFGVDRATMTAAGKTEEVASVKVPDALDAQMVKLGYQRIGAMPEDVAEQRNADGLFVNGPTLAEYVRAGYSAESYPPRGYASKEDPATLAAAQAAAREKREAVERSIEEGKVKAAEEAKAKADADAAAAKAAEEAKAKADADAAAAKAKAKAK